MDNSHITELGVQDNTTAVLQAIVASYATLNRQMMAGKSMADSLAAAATTLDKRLGALDLTAMSTTAAVERMAAGINLSKAQFMQVAQVVGLEGDALASAAWEYQDYLNLKVAGTSALKSETDAKKTQITEDRKAYEQRILSQKAARDEANAKLDAAIAARAEQAAQRQATSATAADVPVKTANVAATKALASSSSNLVSALVAQGLTAEEVQASLLSLGYTNLEVAAMMKIAGLQMKEAAAAAQGLNIGYGRAHAGALSMGQALTPITAALALTAVGVYASVKSFMDWETTLNHLKQNTFAARDTIDDFGKGLLDISIRTGQSNEELADAARRALDFGYSMSEALDIVTQSAQVAAGTGGDVADISEAVSQALHQYGASAAEATNYLNMLIVADKDSNASMQEFAENTKTAVGVAAVAGISFAEVTSALAALTRTYGDAAKAQTQFTNIARYMLSPTKSEKAAWDALSQAADDSAISSRNLSKTLADEGLTGILNRVNEAYGKLGFSIQEIDSYTLKLINSQRGGLGLLELLTSANADYKDGLRKTGDVLSGELNPKEEMIGDTTETLTNKWDRFIATMKSGAITVGEWVSVPAKNLVQSLAEAKLPWQGVMPAEYLKAGVEDAKAIFEEFVGDNASLTRQIAQNWRNLTGQDIPAAIDAEIKAIRDAQTAEQRFARAEEVLEEARRSSNARTSQEIKANLDKQLDANIKNAQYLISSGQAQSQAYRDTLTRIQEITDAQNLLTQALRLGSEDGSKAAEDMRDRVGNALLDIVGKFPLISGGLSQMVQDFKDGKNVVGSTMDDLAAQMEADAATASEGLKRANKSGLEGARRETEAEITQLKAQLDIQREAYETAVKNGEAYAGGLREGMLQTQEALTTAQALLDFLNGLAPAYYASGENNGAGWRTGLDSGLLKNISETFAILGYYSDAADMGALFQELGIETGDNFGTHVNRRIAAWLEPFKKNVMAYVEVLRQLSTFFSGFDRIMGNLNLPTLFGGVVSQIDTLADQAKSRIAGIEAAVTAQGQKAIDEHNAQVAKKAAADAAAAEKAREQAVAALQAAADAKVLAAAEDLVTEAEKELTDATEKATTEIDALTVAINRNKEAEEGALRTFANAAQGQKDRLAELQSNAASDTKVWEKAINDLTEQLEDMGEAAEEAIKPYEEAVRTAQATLDSIRDETADKDYDYQTQLNSIANMQYELAKRAEEAMKPYQAALDAANAAVDAAQARVTALSNAEQNELFPIEQRLLELQQEKAALERSDQLDDEAQSVANLTARLKDLVPGSAEYNSVLKQQKRAQEELGIDTEVDKLTKQKEAIESRYAKQLELANKQLQAAEAQQKAAQAALDAEEKLWKSRKEILDEEADNIRHQQELYDQQQRDKEHAAEQDLKNAQEKYNVEKALLDALQQPIRDQLKLYQEASDKAKEYRDAVIDSQQTIVDQLDKDYGKLKKYYDDIGILLDNDLKIAKEYWYGPDGKSGVIGGLTDAKTAATDYKNALQDGINARKEASSETEALSKYAEAFGVSIDTAKKKLDEMVAEDGSLAKAPNKMGELATKTDEADK
ncbi:MAG TPA: phage tail tape measure protein, partial [Candidatus Paceibacterota bacterium]